MPVDNVFFDTNVLIYLYTDHTPKKRQTVLNLLDSSGPISISTQVINEFVNVIHKKHNVSYETLSEAIEQEIATHFILHTIGINVIKSALSIADEYQYSYYDSLIVASALACDS